MKALLVITPEVRSAGQKVKEFAEDPKNWYKLDGTNFSYQRPPGDDPRHVFHAGTYRVAFSVTQRPDGVYRHLTVSSAAGMPHPYAVAELATMVGFTGFDGTMLPPPDWIMGLQEVQNPGDQRIAVVVQKIP